MTKGKHRGGISVDPEWPSGAVAGWLGVNFNLAPGVTELDLRKITERQIGLIFGQNAWLGDGIREELTVAAYNGCFDALTSYLPTKKLSVRPFVKRRVRTVLVRLVQSRCLIAKTERAMEPSAGKQSRPEPMAAKYTFGKSPSTQEHAKWILGAGLSFFEVIHSVGVPLKIQKQPGCSCFILRREYRQPRRDKSAANVMRMRDAGYTIDEIGATVALTNDQVRYRLSDYKESPVEEMSQLALTRLEQTDPWSGDFEKLQNRHSGWERERAEFWSDIRAA